MTHSSAVKAAGVAGLSIAWASSSPAEWAEREEQATTRQALYSSSEAPGLISLTSAQGRRQTYGAGTPTAKEQSGPRRTHPAAGTTPQYVWLKDSQRYWGSLVITGLTYPATASVGSYHAEWIEEIEQFFHDALTKAPDIRTSIKARGDDLDAIQLFAGTVNDVLDKHAVEGLPLPSKRLDAFLRVRALILLRRLRLRDTYNPEKKKNDALDHELLKYLAYPAGICTDDSKLIASVRASGSSQLPLLLSPYELGEHDRIHEIASLSPTPAASFTPMVSANRPPSAEASGSRNAIECERSGIA